MVGLYFVFFVVLFALGVLLWAGTLGFQGLIYNEPADKLYWRGPLAGAILGGFIALWCFLSFGMFSPATETSLPLDTIFRFNPTQTYTVDKFWTVKNDKETLFRKRELGPQSGLGYFDDQGNAWSRSDANGIVEAIVIEEGDQKYRLKPKLARDKTFVSSAPFPGYYQVDGRRVMEQLGRVSLFQRGLWFLNILFNLLHFGLWFVVLWLVLRFQWPHALGLAAALWLVMTLVPLPMLFDRARDIAQQRAAPPVPKTALLDSRSLARVTHPF